LSSTILSTYYYGVEKEGPRNDSNRNGFLPLSQGVLLGDF